MIISYPAPTLIIVLSAAIKSLAEWGILSLVVQPTHGYFTDSGISVKRNVSPDPKYVYFLLLQSDEFLALQDDEQ